MRETFYITGDPIEPCRSCWGKGHFRDALDNGGWAYEECVDCGGSGRQSVRVTREIGAVPPRVVARKLTFAPWSGLDWEAIDDRKGEASEVRGFGETEAKAIADFWLEYQRHHGLTDARMAAIRGAAA